MAAQYNFDAGARRGLGRKSINHRQPRRRGEAVLDASSRYEPGSSDRDRLDETSDRERVTCVPEIRTIPRAAPPGGEASAAIG